MISEAYVTNLETMRRAAAAKDLGLVVTRLRGEADYVAAIMARMYDGKEILVVPFGMLAGSGIVTDGRVTPLGKAQLNQLLADLTDSSKVVQFTEKDGRVSFQSEPHVYPSYEVVMAWDNPYEIFEDPTQPGFY